MKNKRRMPNLLLISFFLSFFLSMTLKKLRAAYEPRIIDTISSKRSPYGNATGTIAIGVLGCLSKDNK